MWLFYFISLLPLIAGVFLWYKSKQVVWWEWLISFGIALLLAVIFQLIAFERMTRDIETWSGQVTSARQFSRWEEYYEEAIYRTEYYTEIEHYIETDSEGRSHNRSRTVTKSRRVFSHWEPRRRWHNANWMAYTTIKDIPIDEAKYKDICSKFKDEHAVPGKRTTFEHNSKMIDGDPNDYVSDNISGWIEPVTDTRSFENRIKAAPSLFSFSKVPKNVSVYPWPSNPDPFKSQRLQGTASVLIDQLKWDQMNAILGPTKKVNLIIIGFGDKDPSYGQWQQASYIGGKKNDLVLTYGGGTKTTPANWAFVFGWTEKEIVKKNLESLLVSKPINDDLIPLIQEEVAKNYVKKDWHKFDYISIEPPAWSYWVYFAILAITQLGIWILFYKNDIDKKAVTSYKIAYNFWNNDWSKFRKWWNKLMDRIYKVI